MKLESNPGDVGKARTLSLGHQLQGSLDHSEEKVRHEGNTLVTFHSKTEWEIFSHSPHESLDLNVLFRNETQTLKTM